MQAGSHVPIKALHRRKVAQRAGIRLEQAGDVTTVKTLGMYWMVVNQALVTGGDSSQRAADFPL